MAKQIDTVSVYLHLRRDKFGSYARELQRVSAVILDPNPLKDIDKAPIIIEDTSFGVTFDETKTTKALFDAILTAVGAKTGISVFFGAVINRTTFQYITNADVNAYDTNDWLHNPDVSGLAGVPQKYWKVVADTVVEMDANEKAVVDGAELQAAIDAAVASWTADVNKYVASHYNIGQQQTLQTCWIEALAKSWPNRAAMVQTVWDWVHTVLTYFYAQRQAMWDAPNFVDLGKVLHDLTQFDATDPVIITETVEKTNN